MELVVNPKEKKELEKQIAKSYKVAYIISIIAKILWYVGLVCGTLYVVVNFVSPTLSLVEVNGVLKKDISFIIITSSLIYAPCLIFSLCLNVAAKNLAGGHSSMRVAEMLLLTETNIKYSYRTKYQSLASERRMITIDFSKIEKIGYNSETKAIIFVGNFISDYYDNYKKSQPVDTQKIEELIIYDYFTPSLKEILKIDS